MPTSVRGNKGAPTLPSVAAPRGGPAGLGNGPAPGRPPSPPSVTAAKRERGFTLIELMLVVAIIAIATGVVSLALRDPTAAKLEQEAVRLAALLESARAEARSSGVAARWEPLEKQADGSDFRFVGLSAKDPFPTRFLEEGTAAQVIGARAVMLGPEPLIGEQRIVLRLDDQRLTLVTDGIGPFEVGDGVPAAP